MPAPISIVIPTLNSEAELPGCLEALMEGLASGLIRELVISDGGSQDHTATIAEEVGAELLSGAPSRGGQLRRGCEAAQGDWLLILHADTRLSAGWSDAVSRHLEQGEGRPGYFRLAFRARGLRPALVAGWANLRARLFGLPYGDQGLLVHRSDYEALGGYPDQPLMEDVALSLRLKGLVEIPVQAQTSAARYERDGWLRRGARNLWTLARYALGVSPERLARAYRK
ncbi:TIGR04283 family arsenosugar biosynthesis glycosyltransferase [Phaeobacter gallaeciensis]|uniref:TIGR04283 family arsenosugar biosynthesis glycosyltransferase n=1 Tax=Phaeobacter gallaeciensis TaxID=60890 RepID=UPI00237F87DC|nr:TIGR04283 family arsenosugar biosynthesis glycosyltransferase [Phaeobacter gallaeciensis]MDE4191020.1 TIGR04283 family arsenosugar biosynthesis glycosyltransferase [Phaeobacter gallaeciensis]MDE4199486.1 TIGR04283 family arsenosugar biosynthesis glycosyltransferase [Phaeobacter gallaeciensis]MDE4203634.1 TIGR04283 family arsenosugar biosynthesis glycosyltransferase [Phaeobacter gallaeciensis]MDE4207776.1 TIGR04283 family arsenosugar biosynthesis glycosyltransferase [Phaeobacter gallaeciensis